jgi:hypothetical protein
VRATIAAQRSSRILTYPIGFSDDVAFNRRDRTGTNRSASLANYISDKPKYRYEKPFVTSLTVCAKFPAKFIPRYPAISGVIMKKLLGCLVFASIVVLHAGSASAACTVANGETYCDHVSDGAGQPYKPSSFQVTTRGHGAQPAHTNAERAAQAAQRRRQHIY